MLMRAAGESWAWWIRLHPEMTAESDSIREVVSTAGGAFELDSVSALPLYSILPFVDVHLTHSSSTVIEAERFGVASLITSEYGAELYPRQILNGIAVQATRLSDQLDSLSHLAGLRTNPTIGGLSSIDALRFLLSSTSLRQRLAA
jgi:hypothetical protein